MPRPSALFEVGCGRGLVLPVLNLVNEVACLGNMTAVGVKYVF